MEREEDECVKNLYNDELFQLSRDYDSLKKELKDGKISKQDLMKFLMDYDKEDKKNWRKKYVNPRNNKK
ncbi:MAG: hypothetical protein HFJ20_08510 [Clostridia bacterium]|nr:hypothetical protein [Clostridia bacterium]